jgi:hypothetical protein
VHQRAAQADAEQGRRFECEVGVGTDVVQLRAARDLSSPALLGPEVRSALRDIAADETTYAAFSWKLHHWATRRMNIDSRRHLVSAQRRAFAKLRAATDSPHPSVAKTLGLPNIVERRLLLEQLERGLPARDDGDSV